MNPNNLTSIPNVHQFIQTKFVYRLIIALLAGGLFPLAFAPVGWVPLAFASPLLLIWLWHTSSTKAIFWSGWAFGLGVFLVGVSWVFVSMHRFGGLSPFLAGLATFGFALLLGLFFAVQGLVYQLLSHRVPSLLRALLCFPALWVVFELLRAHLFTGFPWLFAGYTQLATPLAGYAPYLGVYGVSLATLFTAGLLMALFAQQTKGKYRLLSLLLLGATWYGGYYLKQQAPILVDKNTPIHIVTVQGNIPQSIKWSPSTLINSEKAYLTLSAPFIKAGNRILIWPENALPSLAQNLTPLFNVLTPQLIKHNNTLLVGMPLAVGNQYFNSAQAYGDGAGVYLKRHLVPFGEYIPLEGLFGKLFGFLDLPMSNFTAGPLKQSPVILNGWPASVFICYEVAYPDLVRTHSEKTAFIAVLSDDGWFGDSFGPWQQAQMAQMRALETGRYVVNSTNNGLTTVIAPTGKVIAQLPLDTRAALPATIYPAAGRTPWQDYGLWLLYTILVTSLFFGFIATWRSKFFNASTMPNQKKKKGTGLV